MAPEPASNQVRSSAETTLSHKSAREARSGAFYAASALLFVASVAETIRMCRSMSGGMAMPGGWTMSMAWMRMSGQTWLDAATSFLVMWVVMMVAMMLPSLTPFVAQFRRNLILAGEARPGSLAALMGFAYFLPWTVVGVAAFPTGALLARAEMRSPGLARNVPLATGFVLLMAGCIQFMEWKARHLGCCRVSQACAHAERSGVRDALGQGVQLGVHCVLCCCGFIAVLLALGVMNLWVMAFVGAAINLERLVPWPARAARAAGIAFIGAGAVMIAQALNHA